MGMFKVVYLRFWVDFGLVGWVWPNDLTVTSSKKQKNSVEILKISFCNSAPKEYFSLYCHLLTQILKIDEKNSSF